MNIHHIGYLVKKMDNAIIEFEKLGYKLEISAILDEARGAYICFMSNGGYCVELISPKSKQSPIYGLMEKHKNSPYHICYETPDLYKTIKELEAQGFMVFQEPAAAPAIGGRQVAFLANTDLGMLEIVEI